MQKWVCIACVVHTCQMVWKDVVVQKSGSTYILHCHQITSELYSQGRNTYRKYGGLGLRYANWQIDRYTDTLITTPGTPLGWSKIQQGNKYDQPYTHTHTRLTALFPGQPRWAGTRKVKLIWILLKQETVSGSGISWAICKSVPCSRQITMPVPHHSSFYRLDALPAAQPTVSKHWRQQTWSTIIEINWTAVNQPQNLHEEKHVWWQQLARGVVGHPLASQAASREFCK